MLLYTTGKIRFALLTILLLTIFSTKGAARPDTSSNTVSYFLLKDENGKTINLTDLKGKVVFLNFWALSCIPCKKEMPTITRLQQHFKTDTNIMILPVDLDNTLLKSTKYMRDNGFGLSVYSVASVVPAKLFHGELPTTVVIDKNGMIVLFKEGEDDYGSKKFFDYMEGLIKK